MSSSFTNVPRPEVHHLPTIFRRLQAGEIRVPAFQRSFRWSEEQILSLLDSVYRGYPVGSLLLWEAKSRVFKLAQPDDLPFPSLPETYPTLFVLDGLQRLSSLFGVFYFDGPSSVVNQYHVVYDLRNEAFKHFDPSDVSEADLPLRALFSVKQLLQEQKRLLSLDDAEVLIERTVQLQSTFQEYLLPTVTISQMDVNEVVEIFSRINSTGTPLGSVDFMRALTWSEDFDLNVGLQRISEAAQQSGFEYGDETVLKLLAVVSGRNPTADDVLKLQSETATDLHALVARSSEVLVRSIGFLKDRCFVHNAQFLPYEGQLLGIAKFFSAVAAPSTKAEDELMRWFWTVSLNEQLRGKPDHYVARQLRAIESLATGEVTELHRRLTVTAADFLERRFITGKALSTAFVCLFAANGARSLVTGEVIPPNDYLREFDPEVLMPIIGQGNLAHLLERPVASARIFANLVLVTRSDARLITNRGWAKTLLGLEEQHGSEIYRQILRSQFLNSEDADALDLADTASVDISRSRKALIGRAGLIAAFAASTAE